MLDEVTAQLAMLLVKLNEEHDPIRIPQCSRNVALARQIFG